MQQVPEKKIPSNDPESLRADDERFMRMALREAMKAFDEKEIPIGCVIVKDGVVIGKGYNQVETMKDATAHAEIIAIGTAASKLDNWRLDGCTLYVTLEPCPMCAGALCHSHIGKIVWAADDPKNGFSRFGNMLHPKTKVQSGLMKDECLALLTDFFKKKR